MNAEAIQPIVLVGGRSSRFGRDKLREPLPGAPGLWLVDRPLAALRAVFGNRVAAVGSCDASVAARFDLAIDDRYPGVGPAGGIASALEAAGSGGAVFVLAGDMPRVSAESVRRIVAAAERAPGGTHAVLAASPGRSEVEPCFGIYFAASLRAVRPREAGGVRAGVGKSPSLRSIVAGLRCVGVPVPDGDTFNVNRADDLSA